MVVAKYMCAGSSGRGKTTWAIRQVANNPRNRRLYMEPIKALCDGLEGNWRKYHKRIRSDLLRYFEEVLDSKYEGSIYIDSSPVQSIWYCERMGDATGAHLFRALAKRFEEAGWILVDFTPNGEESPFKKHWNWAVVEMREEPIDVFGRRI